MKYKCARCGGVSLLGHATVDINSDTIIEGDCDNFTWCEDCEDQTTPIEITIDEYHKIKSIRNKEDEYNKYREDNIAIYEKE